MNITTLIMIYMLTFLIIIIAAVIVLVNVLSKNINTQNKGEIGENRIANKLANYNYNASILRNLYINNNNNTCEVDIVYIHPSALFIIENKNYSGWIYGNEKQQYWTQTFPNGKKYKFYNPIKQNETHKKAIIETLNKNGINTNTFPIYSLIIFDKNNLKKVTYDNTKSIITTEDDLYNTLNYCINNKPPTINISDIEYILSRYTNADEQTKEKHIQRIREQYR